MSSKRFAGTPQFARLPVIMLSHERREEIVTKLIHLGIVGYVAKPPSAEALLAIVERARDCQEGGSADAGHTTRRGHAGAAGRRQSRVSPLLRGAHRSVRKGHGARVGPGGAGRIQARSLRLVFIGGDLGVVGRELLIRKLREMRKGQPLRIVEVHEADEAATAGADDVMPRTLDVAEHRAAVRRFVRITGPLDDLCGRRRPWRNSDADLGAGVRKHARLRGPVLEHAARCRPMCAQRSR